MKVVPYVRARSAAAVRVLAMGGCVTVLAACVGMELEQTRELEPQGDQFSSSLFSGYLDLSEGELSEYDYGASDGFALKARSAAGGDAVLPADPAEWHIPAAHVDELTRARTRLLSALDSSARTKVPDSAAHAQVMFDCWVEEQEEDIQPEDIARCRSGFYSAVVALEVALRPAPEPEPVVMVEPEPEPEPMPEPMAVASQFVVFFDHDSAALTSAARRTIRQATFAARHMKAARILVLGHTDRAGASDYNERLAQRRAQAEI